MFRKRSATRSAMLSVGVAALVIAATGCGGSSKESSSDTTAASTVTVSTTATETTSTSTTSADTTSTDTSTTSTDTSTSGDSAGTGGGSITSKCVDFAGAAAKVSEALGGSGSPTADSASLKAYFSGLASKAPSDIKSAFETLANAIGKYVDEIKGLKLDSGSTPSAETMAKLQKAAAALGTPEVQAASDKINAWVKAGCK